MKMTPKISVIIPSYNHEAFIAKAIKSVLVQTFTDFEIIIADDFSTDNSKEIINSFKDERISTYFFKKNIGACKTVNFLIEKSKAKYIALLNSDDLWEPTKLQEQFDFMEKHDDIGACFTLADFVDNSLHALTTDRFAPANIFIMENRSKEDWFNWFYHVGNALCHPSVLIRSDVYQQLGAYNEKFRQLPDFDMWVRLVQKFEIHILQKKLVHLRWHGDENASAINEENNARVENELLAVLYHNIKMIDSNFFKKVFCSEMINPEANSDDEIICEKFLLLSKGTIFGERSKEIAIRFFYENVTENCFEILYEKYDFSRSQWYSYCSQFGIAGEHNRVTGIAAALEIEHNNKISLHEKQNEELHCELISNQNELITCQNELMTYRNELIKCREYIDKINSNFFFRCAKKLRNFFKR